MPPEVSEHITELSEFPKSTNIYNIKKIVLHTINFMGPYVE